MNYEFPNGNLLYRTLNTKINIYTSGTNMPSLENYLFINIFVGHIKSVKYETIKPQN